MTEEVRILIAILAPLVAGFATLLLPKGFALLRTCVGAAGLLTAFGLLVGLTGRDAAEIASVGWEYLPDPGIDFRFRADALGLFFALLVSGIGTLIVPYAHGYFRGDAAKIGRLLPMLGVFATAMLGVALSDSMMGLFVFWELTTVSSFLLIGWERESPSAVRSALQAAVITGAGGLALLLGLITIGVESGTWLFSEVQSADLADSMMVIIALLVVAAATKSAQFPLHGWLPGAMAAPTPVSAYLHSATMVKAGVFLLARVLPIFADEMLWHRVLIPLGAVTMAYAAVMALRGASVKRVLAFSTVSQLGLFVCLYGLGGVHPEGHHTLEWPVMQILNHALYKAPLFMLAGAMAVHAGVKNVDQLGGLVRRMPVVGWLFLLGLYAMAAGPGTFSFAAKELFLVGAEHATGETWLGWVAIGGVVIAAMCNTALLVRLGRAVLKPADEGAGDVLPGSHWMWWPAALLLLLQVVGGLVPAALSFLHAVETHPLDEFPSTLYLLQKWKLPLLLSLGALAGGVVLGLTALLRKPGDEPCDHLFTIFHRVLEGLAFTVVSALQSGSIRRYLVLTIGTMGAGLVMVIATGGQEWRSLPGTVSLFVAPPVNVIMSILAAVFVCVSALALPPSRLRIVRVMILGAVGFGVTLLYLINRAPDLALTQVMFEIISVIMFLLVMRMLPERTASDSGRIDFSRAVFSGVIGALVSWVVLHAASVTAAPVDPEGLLASRPERLGAWFLEHSYVGSAMTGMRSGVGKNVVNVILVDFRGYDTLGEITVLGLALVTVLAMLGPRRLRPALRGESVRVPGVQYGVQYRATSSILRVGMQAIVPLALIFAGYVFFKGHNLPGGGFIAGLIASVAFIVYRMTEGRDALRSILPLNPALLVAGGLTIAMVTGGVPLVLRYFGWGDLPFLTSGDRYLTAVNNYHLASVMFFDVGVFVVVVGASVGMINRFEEELE